MLKTLEHCLVNVRDAAELPNVVCVAAQAALLLIDKYFSLTDECEVYLIAIGGIFPSNTKYFFCSSFVLSHVPRSQIAMVQGPRPYCSPN